MRKQILLTGVFSLLVLQLACLNPEQEEPHRFRQGVLDLRELTFKEDTIVDLQGEWELYYGDFHYPPFTEKNHSQDIWPSLVLGKMRNLVGKSYQGQDMSPYARSFISVNKP